MGINILNFTGLIAQGIFFLLLSIFIIHTLVLSYHWFAYGTKRTIAFTALSLYLGGGVILFGVLATSMIYF